jgi:hypothetical protein
MKLWQYQSLAEPISQESERITPDKWFSQNPELIRPKRFRTAVFAASLFFVAIVAPVVPTVDAWQQPLSEPVRIVKNHTYITDIQLIVPPVPSLNTWYQQLSEPVRVVQDNSHITPGAFLDIAPFIVPIPGLDTWYRQLSEPVRVIQNHNYITIGALELDDNQRPEIITLDKWYQELSRPVLPKFKPYYYPNRDYRTDLELIIPTFRVMKLEFSAKRADIDFEAKNAEIGFIAKRADITFTKVDC